MTTSLPRRQPKAFEKNGISIDRVNPGAKPTNRRGKAIGKARFENLFHRADNLPETSFKCADQQFPGLYADTEVDCRVIW